MLALLVGGIAVVDVYRAILHNVGVPEEYIYTAFDTRIDHLLVGCAIAVALHHKSGPAYGGSWRAVRPCP